MRPIRTRGDLEHAERQLREAREKYASCPEFYARTIAGWERHIEYILADIKEANDTEDNDEQTTL